MTDSVRRFLVTGPDEHLFRFHQFVCLHLNGIERREQTVIYTCFAEHADFALKAAKRADVTVQEIEFINDGERYPVLCAGSHGMLWVRPSERAKVTR